MRNLHLPLSHHPLDIVGDVIERRRLGEVVARGEIVTNFVRRHVWNDRTVRHVAFECGDDAPKVRDRHGYERIWPLWMQSYSDLSSRTKA